MKKKPSKNQKLLEHIKGELKDNDKMKGIAKPHLDSFNFAMTKGLKLLPKYILPIQIFGSNESKLIFSKKMTISLDQFELGTPCLDNVGVSYKMNATLYPAECREREINYSAPLFCLLTRQFDSSSPETIRVKLGHIPIMVKSAFCNLKSKSLSELIALKEDLYDFGGYFIVNGLEKLIRMITIQRRNYPVAFVRQSATKKRLGCSEFVCEMKCVREDFTSHTVSLHYINDGTVCLRVLVRKTELMIPVILIFKALIDCPDIYLYNKITRGNKNLSKLNECVEVLISDGKKYGYSSRKEYLSHLGKILRNFIGFRDYKDVTNEEIGVYFLKEYICIHTENMNDKFNILCLMTEKLYFLVFGLIKPDNPDSPINHEVLLPGHLYMMVLKEKIEDMFRNLKQKIVLFLSKSKEKSKLKDVNFLKKIFDGLVPLGRRMEYFLSTGNLLSRSGLDLKQQVGYTISAERLNIMRFISHFRSLHRGQFFTQMKTTSPRKLLPDSWGFICPVHTPDGGPIGLLLHMAQGCEIVADLGEAEGDKEKSDGYNNSFESIESSLIKFGAVSCREDVEIQPEFREYPVVLDGVILGYVNSKILPNFLRSLRKSKIFGENSIPKNLELAFIPKTTGTLSFQFPGIYLFNCFSRMVRKVKNLEYGRAEYIGPLEQIYLNVACLPEDLTPSSTHMEIDNVKILSLIAGLTPFSDYNQSPRNLYQCQMGKQTMALPYFNFPFRCDNKVYRILFPQMPIVKTKIYDEFGFDYYPSGTNAIVAVLAYTGYDMEDAMIINKSAYERGFAHGVVYKSKTKTLNESLGKAAAAPKYRLLNLHKFPSDSELLQKSLRGQQLPHHIDADGLPKVGTKLKFGMIEMIYVDLGKNACVVKSYKEGEEAFVEEVRVFAGGSLYEISVNIKYRIDRNPVIGDKFSSRHGQKGVLSQLYPHVNMPFTEQGIVPDCIINPHAFPSRMTIGMLIESLAGKAGVMNGEYQEFKTFTQFDNDDAVGYFGNQLVKNGFDYYGNETMYSGVSGLELNAHIFIGVVYYQRLRHMVGDKAQARENGPIEVLSRQPLKGRKKGGGIRFGEMERDALLAHGISYALNDRLFKSSDYSIGYVCKICGEMIGVMNIQNENNTSNIYCLNCRKNSCVKVEIPYVLRYLSNELAAMNIKLSFGVSEKIK